MVVVLAVLIVPSLVHKSNTTQLTYNTFADRGVRKQVKTATVDQTTGVITGTLTDGTKYSVNGPDPVTDSEQARPQDRSGPTPSS